MIPVVAAGRHDGHLFVATEPVDGRALSTLLGERVPWRRALAIVAALCDACALAHDAGILVTGLVPDEVTVAWETAPPAGDPYRASGSEHVRARMHLFEHVMRRAPRHREPRDVLEVGEHHGFQVKLHALDHLSPEQLMGKPLDGRSDIYNLGAIAYQLATTSLPFADAHGPAGLITAQLKRTPPAPSTLAPELPAAADAIILRCLAKDKAHRFPDAGDARRSDSREIAGMSFTRATSSTRCREARAPRAGRPRTRAPRPSSAHPPPPPRSAVALARTDGSAPTSRAGWRRRARSRAR